MISLINLVANKPQYIYRLQINILHEIQCNTCRVIIFFPRTGSRIRREHGNHCERPEGFDWIL